VVPLDRSRELFRILRERDGLAEAECSALESPLWERYAVDRVRRGNVLEPSLSGAAGELSFYRFSYGFPTFRAEPEAAYRTILAMAEACGPAPAEATRRLRKALSRDCIEQPIVGFASDPGGKRRFKLYLMFRPGKEAEARALAGEVLGAGRPLRQPGTLHMVGLDLGPSGVSGAKLYLEHPAWERTSEYGLTLDAPLSCLAIHAMAAPDDAALEPGAIDFALDDAGTTWPRLEQQLTADHPAAVEAMTDLGSRFRLRIRRVSLFRGTPRKLNVYYVLDERE
jgi:hypothetical protein